MHETWTNILVLCSRASRAPDARWKLIPGELALPVRLQHHLLDPRRARGCEAGAGRHARRAPHAVRALAGGRQGGEDGRALGKRGPIVEGHGECPKHETTVLQ